MKKGWLAGFAWMAVGLILWCASLGALNCRDLQWNDARVGFRLSNGTISSGALDAIREAIAGDTGNAGKATGWGQSLGGTVSAKHTAGSQSVDTLWVDGDASLVWNLPLVSGNLPVPEDTEGIALDLATTLVLFGSTDIIGKAVTIGDADLIVRGVYELPEGISALGVDPGRGLVIRPVASSTSSASVMNALEFLVQGESGADPEEVARGWMQQAGVSTAGTFDDHQDGNALLSLLTGLPALLLLAFILIELWKAMQRFWRGERTGWRLLRADRIAPRQAFFRYAALWIAGLAVLAGAALCAILLHPPIAALPPAYLPTAWSDFAFWPDLIESKAQSAARAALTVALRPDMAYGLLSNWSAGLSIAAIVCLILGRGALARTARDSKTVPMPALAWGGLALAASLPLGLWATGFVGWIPSVPEAALPLACGWWCAFAGLTAARLPERCANWANCRVERTARGAARQPASIPVQTKPIKILRYEKKNQRESTQTSKSIPQSNTN